MVSMGRHEPSAFRIPRLKSLFGERYKSNYNMLYLLYDDVVFDSEAVMDIWDLDLVKNMTQEDKDILWEAIGEAYHEDNEEVPVKKWICTSDREIKALVYTMFEFGMLRGHTLRKANRAFGHVTPSNIK